MKTVSNIQNKRFINKNLKSHILYGEKPLLKAILIVAIPGLLMALMTGIYLFTDQLMLAHFVPVDGAHG
jgi:Na+-driven multidrug efflux pump